MIRHVLLIILCIYITRQAAEEVGRTGCNPTPSPPPLPPSRPGVLLYNSHQRTTKAPETRSLLVAEKRHYINRYIRTCSTHTKRAAAKTVHSFWFRNGVSSPPRASPLQKKGGWQAVPTQRPTPPPPLRALLSTICMLKIHGGRGDLHHPSPAPPGLKTKSSLHIYMIDYHVQLFTSLANFTWC